MRVKCRCPTVIIRILLLFSPLFMEGYDCIGINTCWIVSKIIHVCVREYECLLGQDSSCGIGDLRLRRLDFVAFSCI